MGGRSEIFHRIELYVNHGDRFWLNGRAIERVGGAAAEMINGDKHYDSISIFLVPLDIHFRR